MFAEPGRHLAIVRVWLLLVAAMIVAILLVGGATRLTESGLSIVEWKPVTGALPPLSESAWEAEFGKYQTIPQYQTLNRGMSLAEFKTIYWWEWTHRLLGRLVGAVFLLPFLFFLLRGWIAPGLRWRLWGILGLGGLQGAVGWWMVSSGLAERTSVSQYRLAFHMTLACVIYAAVFWTWRRLGPPDLAAPAEPPRLRFVAMLLAVLVFLQIYLGALVAGLDAGMSYNTWPQIDGALVPSAERLFFLAPAWRNFFENDLMVQFVHRSTAYAIWALSVWHMLDAWRSARRRETAMLAAAAFLVVTAQAAIGIATLLHQVPIALALTHQAFAVLLLTVTLVHTERLTGRPAAAPAGLANPVAAST